MIRLVEAKDTDIAKIKKILKTISNFNLATSSQTTRTADRLRGIQNTTKALLQNILRKDFNSIKGEIDALLSTIHNSIEELKSIGKSVDSKLVDELSQIEEKLKKISGYKDLSRGNIIQAQDILNRLNVIAPEIVAELDEAKYELKTTVDYAELRSQLENLEAELEEFEGSENLSAVQSNLLETTLGNIDEILNSDDDLITEEAINSIISDASTLLNELTQEEEIPYIKDSSNFEDRISNAKSSEEEQTLWEEYFKHTFGDIWEKNRDKILNIQVALKDELLNLGFSENENPFITFLKIYLSKDNSILPKQHYYTLHNSYLDRDISGKMLRGKSLLGKGSTIFNPSIYEFNLNNFSYIIETENYYNDLDTLKSNITRDKISRHYNEFSSNTDAINFLTDLLFDGSDIPGDEYGLSSVTDEVRDAREISAILNYCNINSDNGKVKSVNWKSIVDKLEITKSNINDVITALIIQYSTNSADATKLFRENGLNGQIDGLTLKSLSDKLKVSNINRSNLPEVIEYVKGLV